MFLIWTVLLYSELHFALFTLFCLDALRFADIYEGVYTYFYISSGITLCIGLFILYAFLGNSKVAATFKGSFIENGVALFVFLIINILILMALIISMGLGDVDSPSEFLKGYPTVFKMVIVVPEALFLLIYLAVATYKYLRPKKETKKKSIKMALVLWIPLIAANIFAIPTIGGVLSLIWDFSLDQIMIFGLLVVCPNVALILLYWAINSIVSNKK